jgi:hypothetical protein
MLKIVVDICRIWTKYGNARKMFDAWLKGELFGKRAVYLMVVKFPFVSRCLAWVWGYGGNLCVPRN